METKRVIADDGWCIPHDFGERTIAHIPLTRSLLSEILYPLQLLSVR